MSQKVEKLAILILILFIIVNVSSFFVRFTDFFFPASISDYFTMQVKLLGSMFFLFGISVNIGSSIWLFISAKKLQTQPLVWCLLGLFAGLIAILLWYSIRIYEILKDREFSEKQPNITNR